MMSEFESATARPWSIYDDRDTTGRIEIVAIGKTVARIYQTAGQDDEDIANAKLIFRAVNAHDELVEAVQHALNMVDTDQGPPDWDLLRAALKLARGEQ